MSTSGEHIFFTIHLLHLLTYNLFSIILILETTNGQVATTPVAPTVDALPESSVSESQVCDGFDVLVY